MTPISRFAYLQHGGGEDERVWIEMGRTNVILDNLLASGKVKPMIVVMETSASGAPEPPGGRPGMDGVPPAGGGGVDVARLSAAELLAPELLSPRARGVVRPDLPVAPMARL